LAGTSGNGLFRSVDSAGLWKRINKGLIATRVTSIIVDEASPGVIYVSAYGAGIYKTADLGRSWEIHSEGLQDKYVHVIQQSPEDPLVLFAGTLSSGIYKSIDGGITWRSSNVGLPSSSLSTKSMKSPSNHFPEDDLVQEVLWVDPEFDSKIAHLLASGITTLAVRSICIDPTAPSTMYAGSLGEGVYKSENGGESWSPSGLPGKSVYSLQLNPANPSQIFAGVLGEDGSLLMSSDAGISWFFSNSGLDKRNVYAVAINPNAVNEIFIGTNDGLFLSVDGGSHWNAAGFSGLKVYEVVFDPESTGRIYLGASDGFYYSNDGGINWIQENSGLINPIIQSIAVDEQTSKIFLGTDGSGGFRWNDQLP
jgi:photosystem II stability/assembly factor-like uncharacterized protein